MCVGPITILLYMTYPQVCAIEWSIHDKEFVSSHGFTHNQLILWRYMGAGRVQKVTELTGHQARVLHMARSPDGTTVVSAAADETLRFWRIFGSPTRSASKLKDEQVCRCVCACVRACACACALCQGVTTLHDYMI